MKNLLIFSLFTFVYFLYACKFDDQPQTGPEKVEFYLARMKELCAKHNVPFDSLEIIQENLEKVERGEMEFDLAKAEMFVLMVKHTLEDRERSKQRQIRWETVVKPELEKVRSREEFNEVARKYPEFNLLPKK